MAIKYALVGFACSKSLYERMQTPIPVYSPRHMPMFRVIQHHRARSIPNWISGFVAVLTCLQTLASLTHSQLLGPARFVGGLTHQDSLASAHKGMLRLVQQDGSAASVGTAGEQTVHNSKQM